MAALTCHVYKSLDTPAVGINVKLLCLTHETALHEREFRSIICLTGINGEWEFQRNSRHTKHTLESFLSQICQNQESKWHLVFGTGKLFGAEETSWPIVGLFCILRRAESRTIKLIVSRDQLHAYNSVTTNFESEVHAQASSLAFVQLMLLDLPKPE
jgi:hypothetical protein